MSKSNTVHISHNLLLIHPFYNDVRFSKYLKKQNKFKNDKNRGNQTEHSDFHNILFKFPQAQMSPYNIFYPRQKVSVFPVTSSVPELCSNRCSCSLF